MAKLLVPTEHQEQVALCQWLDYKRIPYFAIPNGGHRNIVTATRLKEEGVKRGVPDIFIPVATFEKDGNIRSVGTFIELKRIKGGKISEDQKAWHTILRNNGFIVLIAYGAKDAIDGLTMLRY